MPIERSAGKRTHRGGRGRTASSPRMSEDARVPGVSLGLSLITSLPLAVPCGQGFHLGRQGEIQFANPADVVSHQVYSDRVVYVEPLGMMVHRLCDERSTGHET